MRILNLVANKLFSILFTWLPSQRLTDMLYGTKVLRHFDCARLRQGRACLGDFDPFGDWGIETRAQDRRSSVSVCQSRYGETQISQRDVAAHWSCSRSCA